MRFCVKFLLSKLRLRKFFDKYHVCLPLHSHGIFVYLCIWSVNHLSFFSDKDFLYWPRPPPYLTKSKKNSFFMPPLIAINSFCWAESFCKYFVSQPRCISVLIAQLKSFKSCRKFAVNLKICKTVPLLQLFPAENYQKLKLIEK